MRGYFIIFLLFSNCFIFKKTGERELKFETFKKGFYSGIREKSEFVIKNKEDFLKLWKNLSANLLPPPEPPEINFGKFMLIAVFMGNKPTGGFNIEIEEIIEKNNEISVYVKEESPGKNCMVTMAFTQPYHIVKLERRDKKIKFYYEDTIRDCD